MGQGEERRRLRYINSLLFLRTTAITTAMGDEERTKFLNNTTVPFPVST
jgi:hypothetical protein